MNRLWAPWRIKYVAKIPKKGCVFCKAYKEKRDRKNFLVLRSLHSFVMLNIFPYNNGHLLIIPNRHIAEPEELKKEEYEDLYKVVIRMLKILKRGLKPHGFNIGINLGLNAGAGIEKHLHIHIVPRWRGDTNFMPVISKTKVVSQGLKDLYLILKGIIQKENRI